MALTMKMLCYVTLYSLWFCLESEGHFMMCQQYGAKRLFFNVY